ncbi:MAG: undecaprenyl-diphosphatase [Chloroflexota bacterium]|jgi:undecaprenyl-diphosphatase|nr:undecaprenyl-diphosphatase [Chloroflexota bacterium]
MDHLVQAIVIGIVQGLTEFLPISSSAHLILLPPLLGWNDAFLNSASFDVMLHLGTLLALLAFFWRDVVRLVSAGIASIRDRSLAGDPDRRLAWLLLVSVVPAAILGFLFESFFDTYFRERLLLVPVLLVVGALVLLAAEWYGRRRRSLDQADLADAVTIGVAQAFALFPGISRSGITIAAGLFRGLEREAAARFAFLMGIPVIGGAGVWKLREVVGAPAGTVDYVALAGGFTAAAVAGFIAIGWMLRFLRSHSTGAFIAYRLAFALVAAALLWGR